MTIPEDYDYNEKASSNDDSFESFPSSLARKQPL